MEEKINGYSLYVDKILHEIQEQKDVPVWYTGHFERLVYLITRCRLLATTSFILRPRYLPVYLLDKRLGGPQIGPTCGEGDTNSLPGMEPQSSKTVVNQTHLAIVYSNVNVTLQFFPRLGLSIGTRMKSLS
jgi:hypothetical protein